MRAPLPFALLLSLFAALPATAQNVAPAPATTSGAGLTDVKSSFDTLRVMPDAISRGKPLKIAVMPLKITYAKQRHDSQPYYNEADYKLSDRDIGQLQKAVVDAFTGEWFVKQQWQLVTDPAAADIRLTVEFRDFWLAAPLKESIHVHKTFTEESARFTLAGNIERTSDQQHLVEFSDRRKVRPPGIPPGRLDRFNTVTFWRDMRREMDFFAGRLHSAIGSGKNGHKT